MTKPRRSPRLSAGAQLRARLDLELGGGGLVWDHRELEILDRAAALADTIAALEAVVARDGLMITGSTGQLRLHPAVVEWRQSQVAMLRMLDSLALPQATRVIRSARNERKSRNAHARWGRGVS